MIRLFFEKVKTNMSTDRYFHQYRKTVWLMYTTAEANGPMTGTTALFCLSLLYWLLGDVICPLWWHPLGPTICITWSQELYYVIHTFGFQCIIIGEKIQLVEYHSKWIKNMLHARHIQKDVHVTVYLACFPSPSQLFSMGLVRPLLHSWNFL
jgi:hypothetical protein